MDTKSTKFKYTNISKAISLLLATLLFTLGTWCAVELGIGSLTFGPGEYFANDAAQGRQSFTATPAFEEVLEDDIGSLQYLATVNRSAYEKAYADAQEETVEAIVDQYMARQKYLKQQNLDPLEENFARSPTVHLKTADIDDDTLSVDFEYDTMALSEKDIRKELNRQYDNWEAEQLGSIETDRNAHVQWLNTNESLGYYVRSVDGTVYTNLSGKPVIANVKDHDIYAGKDSKRSFMSGIDYAKANGTGNVLDEVSDDAAVYFWLDDPTKSVGDLTLGSALHDNPDEYFVAGQLYNAMKERPAGWILGIMIFCYLAALALLLWFLHLVGRKGDGSEKSIAVIDKVPGDVHFALSAIVFGCCFGIPLAAMADAFGNRAFWPWMPLGGALTAFVCFLLLAEWLASVCRTVKSGHGYWKHTLIGRFAVWLWKKCKYIAAHWKDAAHMTKYAPKYLPKHVFWMVLGYLFLNALLLSLLVHSAAGALTAFYVLLFLAFNLYVLAKVIRYLTGLDELIAASGDDADTEVNEEGLPISLKTLAGNLAVSRSRIDKAVEKAVKEEQTRTELITNVTHDLKTPLTSLISYSDLLNRKAELDLLGDEESKQYVNVLHDQSVKLKNLIDDLLEATKVSTGNVQLNATALNLTELAAQAIAEFAPEMEANGNHVVFVDGSGGAAAAEHLVYADGSKTYRILANLLSNAMKYSAPNTRVYATVSDGPAGPDSASLTTVFELKNTSAEPLNISAEELMARFVRGDRSRGETEGNGLGLSIARDLAALMGGSLELAIDGDLFKATLTLPKQG